MLPGNTYIRLCLIEFVNVKPFEDLHSGVGSPSHAASIEVQRANVVNKVTPAGINQFVSPGNSGMKKKLSFTSIISSVWRHLVVSIKLHMHFAGDAVRYTGSSLSGDGVPSGNLEANIERFGSKKKNVHSTSKNSGSLDTVVEVFHEADTDYKLSRPKRKNLEPDHGNKAINFYFAITVSEIAFSSNMISNK